MQGGADAMKTTATNKKVRELMIALRSESLVPRPYFQRRLVWTARHKQLFIQTVLDGYPFPEIFLCDGEVDLETGKGAQLVVDGQQRITTLHQYFLGSEDLRLGDLVAYRGLTDGQKQAFLDYEVVVRDLGRLTDIEVREVFRRMNSTNYSLNAMEVNNARFNGALKQFAEEVSKWPIFEEYRVFTLPDIRRMNDVRWTLTLAISTISGYFNRDAEHEAYLRRFNDEFPERDRVEATLRETCDLVDRIGLGARSRAWQKNDLLTLLVEVYRKDPTLVINEDDLGESLRTFYSVVDAVSEGSRPSEWEKDAAAYHAAVISGSNDRASRIRRGTALEAVLRPHFNSLRR
jgi:uncharacterized protein DUF262